MRDSFSQVPRTLSLVYAASRGGAVSYLVLTLLAAALPLLVAFVGKRIIDVVVAGDRASAIRWVGAELALIASLSLVQRGLSLLRSLLGARLAVDINVRILEKALTLDLSHFEDPDFYDKLTRARREASMRPIAVVSETFQILQNGLTLGGYVALLVGFSGWAVLGLVAAAVPATVAEMRFSGQAFRLRNWRAPEARRLNYLEYVLANDGHAKEVQLFGLGPLLLGRYKQLGESIYREDRALALRRSGWAYGLSLLATISFYACYGYIAFLAAQGRLSLGNLTLYVVAFRQGQQAFQSVLGAIGGMYEDNLYMSNLFAFLAIPTGLQARPRSAVLPPTDHSGVRFEDVGFRYPGQEIWALRHIDIAIPPGESLALVGQNGSGKTTFIKLLTRLYEPTEGRVLLDGRDLRDWDIVALRRRIGVIFQDFNRYQLPLRENVGAGSVDHLADEDRVVRAVGRGGADDIVAGLKQGLDTPLGRWFRSEGVELSGGQWQRVALARAFMREEADILVLDEPTAALDAEAEHAVFERFRALSEGRTTILISHRFPTVRTASRIVVLANGGIVESGTHEGLLAQDGRYARLFRLQAQGYLLPHQGSTLGPGGPSICLEGSLPPRSPMLLFTLLAAVVLLLALADLRSSPGPTARGDMPGTPPPPVATSVPSPYRAAVEQPGSSGAAEGTASRETPLRVPMPPPPRRPSAGPAWQTEAERFIALQCRARSRSEHFAAARAGERLFRREPVAALALQIARSWRDGGSLARALAWVDRASNERSSKPGG